MKTRIIKIGNSQGIRIPKPLIEQAGLCGDVDIQLANGSLVIRPVKAARAGWADAFRAMAAARDDRLIDGDLPALTEWDHEEWEW